MNSSLSLMLKLVTNSNIRHAFSLSQKGRPCDGIIRRCFYPGQQYSKLSNQDCSRFHNKPAKKQLIECSQFSFSTNCNTPDKPPSIYQRFKLMYKEYWYVLLPVHVVTSTFWIGGFYYLAVSGIDISAILEIMNAPESWVTTIRESKAGGIVTAYTMYKIATPARYTVTLGGTTVSINYLKKWGYIKPIPSRDKLKSMYEEKKSALKEKVTATKDEIRDEFSKTRDEITQHMKEAKSGFQQSVTETRQGFKEGVRDAADEWKHVGKLVKRNVTEIMKAPKKEGNK